MSRRPRVRYFLGTLGLTYATGCGDLRLADRLPPDTTASEGGRATATSANSTPASGGRGGTSSNSGGRGGTSSNSGGRGGVIQSAHESAIAGTNANTGGTSSSSGGTSSSSGGTSSSSGGTSSSDQVCPGTLSKPDTLVAAEPTPVDACARVSNVVRISSGHTVFGFTNGEIYLFSPSTSSSQTRVDTWNTSIGLHALPKAIVTSFVAPRINHEGALQVGYADPQGTKHNTWWTGAMARGWLEATVEEPGTVMTLTACPFHNAQTHYELATPWLTQGSLTSGAAYAPQETRKLNQHLQLAQENYVTAIENVTKADGWLVYVGTESGQIYVSNLLPQSVNWDETTGRLSTVVTWTRITDTRMPQRWITRLAVHPAHPERIFAVFHSNDGDALWYSADSGQTWSNRQANLPRMNNPLNNAPPVLGVSFNPFIDGAAYAVTSLTSYYSVDYGLNWSEW